MSEERKYQEPSDLFMRIICNGGSPVQDCELCGRTHFDFNGEFMEEGELDRLLNKQKESPDKYIGQDGGITSGEIDCRTVVWGCPCNRARRFEDFIWKHRSIIAEYLRRRCAENLKSATDDMDQIGQVKI